MIAITLQEFDSRTDYFRSLVDSGENIILTHKENHPTAEEKKAIDRALQSVKEGKCVPHEVVMANFKMKYPEYY